MDLQILFLNNVKEEVDEESNDLAEAFLNFISGEYFAAKEKFMEIFVQKAISNILHKINESKEKRKKGKTYALNSGNKLIKETSEDFKLVRSTIAHDDLRFINISDKLALEVFSCGLDYFMLNRENEIDPGPKTMKIFEYAKTLAVGKIALQKIDENIGALKEWIAERPQREKHKRVKSDFDALTMLIEKYEIKTATIEDAASLLAKSQIYLHNVKHNLGSYDDIYIGFSTRIASIAQGICITVINSLQKNIEQSLDNNVRLRGFIILKDNVEMAWRVSRTLSTMDVNPDMKQSIQTNKNALSNLRNQLSPIESSLVNYWSSPLQGNVRPYNNPHSNENWASRNPGCTIFLALFILYLLAKMCS